MSNAQKKPLAVSLEFNSRGHSKSTQHQQQKSIPCTVTKVTKDFVTVKFEAQDSIFSLPQVTIPQSFSKWAREPTQVGDKGWAVVADYYMGGQSENGGGTADLKPRGNLTNLIFQPNSKKNAATRDQNAFILGGPNGAVVGTNDGSVTVTVSASSITLKMGGVQLVLNGSGVAITGGTVTHNGKNIGDSHVHSGVQAGGNNTGPPT